MSDPDDRVLSRAAGVRLAVFDFDGVMTDNRVYVAQDGTESVCCWRGDGIGLSALRSIGVQALVLSKERNPVVGVRCEKLGVECVQGCDDKGLALHELVASHGVELTQVAFLGNDVNDLPCLEVVGLPVVTQDAHEDVQDAALYRTRAKGGRGAVRELCDLIVRAKGVQA